MIKIRILAIYMILILFGLTTYLIKFIKINQIIEIKYFRNDLELKELILDETEYEPIKSTIQILNEEKLSLNYVNNKIKQAPLIFIGGYARSGTTLTRAILDVHPDVSCGPETKIIPAITKFIKEYIRNPSNKNDLDEAGIDTSIIDSALAFFIYHIMENHIKNLKHLCIKDPDIVYHIEYLNILFPKAKFIYMVRDGRAVSYSMVEKLEKIKNFEKMFGYLQNWNNFNMFVNNQCEKVGENVCMIVKYEDLILKTNETLRTVVEFLNLSWTDDFMRHQEFIGNKIVVSKTEWSTDQIKNPIYTSSIDKWKEKMHDYDSNRVRMIARMLKTFGYQV